MTRGGAGDVISLLVDGLFSGDCLSRSFVLFGTT
jgi:hypothetical protein